MSRDIRLRRRYVRPQRITGQTADPYLSLCKLMWLRHNEPELFQRMCRWLCIEDWIIFRLAGEYATDYTIASRTMAFDQVQHTARRRRSRITIHSLPAQSARGLASGWCCMGRPAYPTRYSRLWRTMALSKSTCGQCLNAWAVKPSPDSSSNNWAIFLRRRNWLRGVQKVGSASATGARNTAR